MKITSAKNNAQIAVKIYRYCSKSMDELRQNGMAKHHTDDFYGTTQIQLLLPMKQIE